MHRLGSTVARLKLKGIDGGSHKRWSMWLNSKQREEPYPGFDMHGLASGNRRDAACRGTCTGAAWLSSARAVKCRLSPLTSATPIASCQRVMAGTLARLPVSNRRKVGMTSSPHGLYVQGCTRATMAGTERRNTARWSKSQKPAPVRIAGCNSPA